MSPQTKKLVLSAVAIVGIVVAVVMYVRSSESSPVDQEPMSVPETFTCSQCGAKFQMTVAEQAEMYRTKGSIICSKCGAPGAEKFALIRLRPPPTSPGEAQAKLPSTPAVKPNEPDAPAKPAIGMTPIK